jgi:primosomal protein N' (replication factor Y)
MNTLPLCYMALLDQGKLWFIFIILKKLLTKGYQVLVLLPEIALTKQISDRFKEFIGHEPATWHSGIKDKDKKLIWNGISSK